MKGHTHIIIGATAALVAYRAGWLPVSGWAMAAACVGANVVGSLLPDIDSDESVIRQATGTARHNGCLGRLASFVIGVGTGGHRAATHSLIALGVMVAEAIWFGQPWAWAAAIGYVAHVAADMLTKSGVPLLWPMNDWRMHLMPPGLRITTGSFIEYLCAVALVAAIARFAL